MDITQRQEVASVRRKKPGGEGCIQLFQHLSRKYFHKVKDHGHEEVTGIFLIERERAHHDEGRRLTNLDKF